MCCCKRDAGSVSIIKKLLFKNEGGKFMGHLEGYDLFNKTKSYFRG
jgi:hypothetical protein